MGNKREREYIYIYIYIYIFRFQWHGVYDRGINDGDDKRIKKALPSQIMPNNLYLHQSHYWRSPVGPDGPCKTSLEQCLSPRILWSLRRSLQGIISHHGGAGVLTNSVSR